MKKTISLVRVVIDFYPKKGGSITHTMELAKKINPHLGNQIIIAPDFGEVCKEFDERFGVPIMRVEFPWFWESLKASGIPVVPLIVWKYTKNVVKEIKQL